MPESDDFHREMERLERRTRIDAWLLRAAVVAGVVLAFVLLVGARP